jgi:hypothetical protein
VRVYDPRTGPPHGIEHGLRAQAAADEARGGRGAAQRGRVPLHERGRLPQVLLGEPAQVVDRALLAARRPVPVVEEEDHVVRQP